MRQAWVAAFIGVIDGLLSGLTGMGGGAILVSLMVAWLGMSQHRAQGTSPAVITPLALLGAVTYGVQGVSGLFRFDMSFALSLLPALTLPGIAGVVIGTTWMSTLPTWHLRRVFGVFLVFVAGSMLTRGILPIGTPEGAALSIPFIFWILLGFVAGVFSGFLGIGGAMVIIPFMTLGAGIPQHMTQGISLAVVAMTAAVGAYTQYRLGHVDVGVAGPMVPGAVIAATAASLLAGRLDSFWLTKIFGLTMAYFAYEFTFQSEAPGGRAGPARGRAAPDFYHI